MRRKVTAFVLLLTMAATSFAQTIIAVHVQDVGDKSIFANKGLPVTAPSNAIKFDKASVDFPLSGDSDHLFIWDKTSGNIATAEAAKLPNGAWTVGPSSFTDIATVRVHVEHAGKAVAAASVELKDERHTTSQLLTPSMKGDAEFFYVKPGQLKVTVKYTAAKKEGSTTQIFEGTLQRSDPVPTFVVSLPAAVDTIDGGATPAVTATTPAANSSGTPAAPVKDGKAKTSDEHGNPLGNFVMYVVALGIAVAAGLLAMRFIRQNPDTVSAKLEQLGVQIPKPGDQPLSDPGPGLPDPTPAPVPIQKIVLDDAAPTPLAVGAVVSMPSAAVSVSPSAGQGPRLVSEAGIPSLIADGESVLGRDAGLAISFVGETSISRNHARIVRNGGQVVVSDLGSTNGTYVNGAKLQGEVVLRQGDTVQFGALRFRYEE